VLEKREKIRGGRLVLLEPPFPWRSLLLTFCTLVLALESI